MPHPLCLSICNYRAPEILAGQAYSGAKADAWSLGVLLFILLAGTPPLRSATSDDWWFKAILLKRLDKFWQAHEQMTPGFPKAAQGIVSSLLVANPAERAAVDDVASDPWLTGEVAYPEELYREMLQRKEAAEQRKSGAHSEALARKQAEAAAATAANCAAPVAFDSFAARTHRALDGDLCPPPLSCWQQQVDVVCAWAGGLGGRAQGFYVLLPGCMQTLQKVQRACEAAGATEITRADVWQLRVSFLGQPGATAAALTAATTAAALSTEAAAGDAKQQQQQQLDMPQQPLRRPTALELQLQLFTAELQGEQLSFVLVERRAGDVFAARSAQRAIMMGLDGAALATDDDALTAGVDAAPQDTLLRSSNSSSSSINSSSSSSGKKGFSSASCSTFEDKLAATGKALLGDLICQ
jgi:Protein kinase domain